jgi:tight adherence protein B
MNAPLLLLVGLVASFGALFLLAFAVLNGEHHEGAYQRVRDALRRRPPNPTRSIHQLAEQASDFAERSLERGGRRGRLENSLERAGINMRPGEFAVMALGACLVAFMLGLFMSGFLLALILGGLAAGATRLWVNVMVERRRTKFESQLEETLPLMSGSLRAGFGLMQTLDAVARESDAPTSDEFRRLVMESRLGRDLGDSLEALAERVQSEDFEFVVQAIEIHRQVGGDLAEVLDQVASTIRDRNRVRRQIKSLTAEGRMSAGILFGLPLVMFVVINFLNPGYLHELTGTTLGRVLLAVGLTLIVVGGLWMRRLIRLVF